MFFIPFLTRSAVYFFGDAAATLTRMQNDEENELIRLQFLAHFLSIRPEATFCPSLVE